MAQRDQHSEHFPRSGSVQAAAVSGIFTPTDILPSSPTAPSLPLRRTLPFVPELSLSLKSTHYTASPASKPQHLCIEIDKTELETGDLKKESERERERGWVMDPAFTFFHWDTHVRTHFTTTTTSPPPTPSSAMHTKSNKQVELFTYCDAMPLFCPIKNLLLRTFPGTISGLV